jgi:hypothetical protein
MNNYINNLAKEILNNEPDGLSKVRFAKTIYFVHKGLIQNNLIDSKAMKFIRMPLGPVPVGFKDLHSDPSILVKTTNSSLTYNTETYLLKDYQAYFEKNFIETIGAITKKLKNIPTSELIEISHKEPSWSELPNGSEYFISINDLKQLLPTSNANNKLNPEIDNQRIQARLVEGMLHEIVDESTSLEYPDKK